MASASLEARKKLIEELKAHPFNYAAMQAIQADFCKAPSRVVGNTVLLTHSPRCVPGALTTMSFLSPGEQAQR
eukprot:scaffold36269_cov66-Phaeocystis_antarctica.AAC.2